MRGVTCSAPNCTVSPMATSKLMMRPVILSSPENSAPLFAIFCDGGSGMTSSPGCGEVSAGCGVPRGGAGRAPDQATPAHRARRVGSCRVPGGGKRLRLDAAAGLARNAPASVGMLLLGIALVRVLRIALLLRRLLRRLAAAGTLRRRTRRRAEKRLERIDELRRRRKHAKRGLSGAASGKQYGAIVPSARSVPKDVQDPLVQDRRLTRGIRRRKGGRPATPPRLIGPRG